MKKYILILAFIATGLGEAFAQSVLYNGGNAVNVDCDKVHFDYCDGLACVLAGGYYYFVDGSGNRLPDKYDSVGYFDSNNLCIVQIKGKYGLVDSSAHLVLDAKYDSISEFSPRGYARITLNGKIGFIDTSASVVVTPKYAAIGAPNSKGYSWVNVGGSINESGVCQGGKYGYIDANIKEVVEPKYTFIGNLDSAGICWACLGGKEFISDKSVEVQMSSFSHRESDPAKILAKRTELENAITGGKVDVEGRKVYGGKYGFVSVSGKEITEIIYGSTANRMTNGCAWVALNGRYGYIDEQGNSIVACVYDEIAPTFTGNIVWARKTDKKSSLYGYVNRQGVEVTPFAYSKVTDVKDGLAVVCTPAVIEKGVVIKAARYGLLDAQGRALTETIYDGVSMINEGMALCKKGNRYCFVNSEGKEVTPAIINAVTKYVDGVAIVKLCPADAAVSLKGGKLVKSPSSKRMQDGFYGVIDKSGTVLVDFIYNLISPPSCGMLVVTKGGKSFFIRKNGETLSSVEYDEVKPFSQNYAAVKVDGKWGWIDIDGNMTVAPAYDNAHDKVIDGLFCAYRHGCWGAVSPQGVEVVPFGFSLVEDLEDALKTIYVEAGKRILTSREVFAFQARKLNETKRFNIVEEIPVEYWDY